jgi:phosphodiesterase/alkaline phosphatase D-like protein
MTVPLIRDVSLALSRSGGNGTGYVDLTEALVRFWTGRHATPALGKVEWGETPAYGSSTLAQSPAAFHQYMIGGLDPGKRYFFRVTATDPSVPGDAAASQQYAFTATPGELPPGNPTLVHQPRTGLTATGVTIPWTSSPACPNGQVNYSTSPALDPLSVKSESGTGNRTGHTVTLSGLTANTRYYYRIFQVAPNGASTYSSLQTFQTTA